MSEEITVVIVDDEAASVRNLSNDLCVYSDVRILETTTSVEKARKIVIRQQPDLLFLDVEDAQDVRFGSMAKYPCGCPCRYACCFLYSIR